MLSLKNKIILITGASSGIGKSCAFQFAALGAKLILAARRLERLKILANDLKQTYQTESLILELDVRSKLQVQKTFQTLPKAWETIDVLVNNAGLALGLEPLQMGNIEQWDTMIDTNIKGLLYVTRAILPGMLERNSGHIINIGSVAGREYYPKGNVYSATKHAVKAINQSLRLDLLGTSVRVSEVAPGAVETEFSEIRFDDKERAKQVYTGFIPLTPDDIADAVIYCATRPLHVNITELTLMPSAQASANHIYRKTDL